MKSSDINKEKHRFLLRKVSSETFVDFLKDAMEDERSTTAVERDFLVSKEDQYIRKSAGIMLSDTSPEGVEQHLMQYMFNELSFFPEHVDVQVEIYPEDAAPPSGMMSPVINSAVGNIHLLYRGADIIIPFMIRDRQLLPFDVIQMGQEQAVFTRENLKKVLFALSHTAGQQPMQPGMTPQNPNNVNGYVGVDRAINNTTDTGFLNDVLRVQNMAANNGLASTASDSLIEDLLDKTAKFEKITMDYNKLQLRLKEELKPEAEKVASPTEYQETEEEALVKAAAEDILGGLNLMNVHLFPSGSFVSFPEKDGKILQTTRAKLFKTLLNGRGVTLDNRILLVTSDRRWAEVRGGERFLVQPDEAASWDCKYEPLRGVKPGMMYTIGINNAWTVPFAVTKVVLGSEFGLKLGFVYYCIDVDGNKFIVSQADGLNDKTVVFMSRDKAIATAVRNEKPEKLAYYHLFFKKDMPVVFLPESAKVIMLRGVVRDHVTNSRNIMHSATEDFFKEATGDKVTITLVSRDENPLYNIDIQWTDRHHTPPLDKKVSFTGKHEGVVKGVLKTIGFTYNEALEGILKAKNDGVGVLLINNTHTPWIVRPDEVATRQSKGIINEMREAFFNKDSATTVAASILGGVVGASLVGSVAGQKLTELSSFASDESSATAIKFEKLAYDRQSPSIAKVAKLLIVKNRLDNLMRDALSGGEYDNVKEAFERLPELEPTLSKIAYDLIQLKVAQAVNGNEILSPSVIGAALRHLDGLLKYAKATQPILDLPTALATAKPKSLADVDAIYNNYKATLSTRVSPPATAPKQAPKVDIDAELAKYTKGNPVKTAAEGATVSGSFLHDRPMRKESKKNKGLETKLT